MSSASPPRPSGAFSLAEMLDGPAVTFPFPTPRANWGEWTCEPGVATHASGVRIDIGPGQGDWNAVADRVQAEHPEHYVGFVPMLSALLTTGHARHLAVRRRQ